MCFDRTPRAYSESTGSLLLLGANPPQAEAALLGGWCVVSHPSGWFGGFCNILRGERVEGWLDQKSPRGKQVTFWRNEGVFQAETEIRTFVMMWVCRGVIIFLTPSMISALLEKGLGWGRFFLFFYLFLKGWDFLMFWVREKTPPWGGICLALFPKLSWWLPGFESWVWRRKWHPIPVSLSGVFHGQKSLAGYSPWGRREVDMTEPLNQHSPGFGVSLGEKPGFLCNSVFFSAKRLTVGTWGGARGGGFLPPGISVEPGGSQDSGLKQRSLWRAHGGACAKAMPSPDKHKSANNTVAGSIKNKTKQNTSAPKKKEETHTHFSRDF